MNYTDIISKWKEKKIDSIEKLDQQLSNFRITFAIQLWNNRKSTDNISCYKRSL